MKKTALFKNKKLLTIILLTSIVFVASVLRLWQLGNVPPSPDWDEASLGYNAYSVLHTGRDEYGKFMPSVLQSFNDYKPSFYIYLIIPFLPLFDLSIIAVRLPSVILGILSVFATYFLIKELFKRKDIALITTFLLAISPWHIQFSRVAFEANVGLSFNIFAVLFFLKGLKRPWLLILSAVFMGLNLSVYQSERVFTPLLVVALVSIFWKQVFVLPRRYLLTAFLVGIIAAAPFLFSLVTNKQALDRAKGVSIFSAQTKIVEATNSWYLEDKKNSNFISFFFHHKGIVYGREMLSGYLSHYDMNWLFIKGDLERHHAPGMGLLYLWELPFLLVGLYALLFFQFPIKTKLFIFAWFLLAPFPASITNDVPHAVRTLNFLPTFQVFIALGVVTFYQLLQKSKRAKIFAFCYALFVIFNFVYYLNQYFVQQNYAYAKYWQYGYSELVPYVKSLHGSVEKVIISDVSPLDQSYIFFLFYDQVNPLNYQKTHAIYNYEFRKIDWEKDKTKQNVLFVGTLDDFSEDVSVLKTITYPDGSGAMVVVKK